MEAKKIIFSVLTLVFTCQSLMAWHAYHPFVKENKRWVCDNNVEYIIKGDTVINDVQYKKVLLKIPYISPEYDYHGAVREDGRLVYFRGKADQEEYLLYDFNAGIVNNEVIVKNNAILTTWMCYNQAINGQERRYVLSKVLFKGAMEQPIATAWFVEGIGYRDPFTAPISCRYEARECYEDDQLICTKRQINSTQPSVPTGDIDGSGAVDVGDINTLIDIMTGHDICDNWDEVEANLVQPDIALIDISDVNAIINAILDK